MLRLKDNNCHLVEAERVLKKASKFTELVSAAMPIWCSHNNVVPWFKKFKLFINFASGDIVQHSRVAPESS